METKHLTCIGCPMGCQLTVKMKNKEVIEVAGNTCKKGDIYARKEVTNPTRIVTTSVPVNGGDLPMVSCKTKEDIPKDKIYDVIKSLENVCIDAPVFIGDIIISNVCDTGVDIVATKNVCVK